MANSAVKNDQIPPARPQAEAPAKPMAPSMNAEAPPPKPTPAMDKQWKCEIQPRAEGEITVGTKLVAVCEGEPAQLDRARLKIENREDVKYALHLLEVKSLGETKAELIVTPWMAGELKIPNPALTDGRVRIGMGDQELNVTSVINPKDNPEGKPYPPWGPMTLPWPVWVWLIVAMIAGVISLALWLAIRRSVKRKKLLALLEKNATALSPFNHFNKELRKLVKQIPPPNVAWGTGEAKAVIEELDKAFRWFLARELVVPAIEASPSKILSEIKISHASVYESLKRDLKLALDELEKAKRVSSTPEDANQLAELCRSLADRIVKERGV